MKLRQAAKTARKTAACIASPWFRRRPALWSGRLHVMAARTLVSFDWGYVVVRIPKAGNSSLMETLHANFPESAPAAALGSKRAQRRKRYSYDLSEIAAADLPRVRDSMVKVSLVRHPYDRVLSAYRDKIERGDPKRLGRHGRAIAAQDGGTVTFRGFCRWLARGGERLDPHWMRQTRLLDLVGYERFDVIGQMEHFDRDVARILQAIGGPGAAPELHTAGQHATHARDRRQHYYDRECYEIIASLYRRDFDWLGYDAG